VAQRKKTQFTLCVNVNPCLHPDMHILIPYVCTQRILRVKFWEPSGTLVKEQGSLDLVSLYGAQRACFKAYVHLDRKGSNSAINLIYPSATLQLSKVLSSIQVCSYNIVTSCDVPTLPFALF